mmetsp:Transcript_10698/g.24813  ORF Transcript_10698/g.24813 Transcript_10698/m.24813 type:complete len:331 (+) Transcript_10698:31-1023(+)
MADTAVATATKLLLVLLLLLPIITWGQQQQQQQQQSFLRSHKDLDSLNPLGEKKKHHYHHDKKHHDNDKKKHDKDDSSSLTPDFPHLMECMFQGGSSAGACHSATADGSCVWCKATRVGLASLCVSLAFATDIDGVLFDCESVGTDHPTVTPTPTAFPTAAYVIVDDDSLYPSDDDDIFQDDDFFPPPFFTPAPITPAPITSAPITSAPITPAPVTPAPITPAPVTPAPTPIPTTSPTMSPTADTQGYMERLQKCLLDNESASACEKKKKHCVWCEYAPMSGLCLSEQAAEDHEGTFYSCHWKKKKEKYHHHHHTDKPEPESSSSTATME